MEGPCGDFLRVGFAIGPKVQVLLKGHQVHLVHWFIVKLKAKPRVVDSFKDCNSQKYALKLCDVTRNCQISAQPSTRWVASMSFKAKLNRERSLVTFPKERAGRETWMQFFGLRFEHIGLIHHVVINIPQNILETAPWNFRKVEVAEGVKKIPFQTSRQQRKRAGFVLGWVVVWVA